MQFHDVNEAFYVRKVIRSYLPKQADAFKANKAIQTLTPYIKHWAYPYFINIRIVGSFAKRTNITGNTDIDIFIFLKSTFSATLEDIYNNLHDYFQIREFQTKKKNIAVQVVFNNLCVDLVPGRRQPGRSTDHSVYCNRTKTWKQTNVIKHVQYVRKASRTVEIRAIKIWRDLNGLDFPSFHLELSVIDALKGARISELGGRLLLNNINQVFQYLSDDFVDKTIIDPSNSNNIVSDTLMKKERQKIQNKALIASSERSLEDVIW